MNCHKLRATGFCQNTLKKHLGFEKVDMAAAPKKRKREPSPVRSDSSFASGNLSASALGSQDVPLEKDEEAGVTIAPRLEGALRSMNVNEVREMKQNVQLFKSNEFKAKVGPPPSR
jgi:hypothetical protein